MPKFFDVVEGMLRLNGKIIAELSYEHGQLNIILEVVNGLLQGSNKQTNPEAIRSLLDFLKYISED